VLLPKDNKLLIKCKVTNSVRISWLKPTNEKVDVPNDLSKSHLYPIKDLFGNYVFAGTRLLKLSSNVGSNDTVDEYYTVSNVSRFEGINIYNTFVGSTQKFLASLNPTSLAHEPKIGTRSIYEETYKVYAIDLYKLYNIISSRKIIKHIINNT